MNEIRHLEKNVGFAVFEVAAMDEYVARNDVGYLKWFVENVDDVDDEDLKILEALIRRFDRG